MHLPFKPGEFIGVSEDPLADCGAIHHTVGFDLRPPAAPEGRDDGLTIQQIMDDPVSRNRGGTKAPEDFERDRLAGGNAAGQSDR